MNFLLPIIIETQERNDESCRKVDLAREKKKRTKWLARLEYSLVSCNIEINKCELVMTLLLDDPLGRWCSIAECCWFHDGSTLMAARWCGCWMIWVAIAGVASMVWLVMVCFWINLTRMHICCWTRRALNVNQFINFLLSRSTLGNSQVIYAGFIQAIGHKFKEELNRFSLTLTLTYRERRYSCKHLFIFNARTLGTVY